MRVRALTIAFLAFLFTFLLAAATLPAVAQTLITTVPAGYQPGYLAANPATNMIYVSNICGNDPTCASDSSGTMTVINGVTNQTSTVAVGQRPNFFVINPKTNKIYVTNRHSNNVSVLDGATNTVTATIPVGSHPVGADINPSTNTLYVANSGNGLNDTVSVIDMATNTVTATITVGWSPNVLAVNPITNKVYVVNRCGNDPNGCATDGTGSAGTLSVIDGATNTVTNTLNLGISPGVVFVNPLTNKIYAGNGCGSDPQCLIAGQVTNGSVSVIDGATLNVQTVVTDYGSDALTINPVTNQIYVSNACGTDPTCASNGTVSFIDGVSLATSRVTVGMGPADVEVDPVANKLYVTNSGSNTLMMIDGATNQISSVGVQQSPIPATVNPVTHRVYVDNVCGTDPTCSSNGSISIIAGVGPNALQFVAVAPCRLVDTRNPNGPFGGPPIPGTGSRSFAIPMQTPCDIPATAAAYSLNVTLVPLPGVAVGFLSIWPTGESQPLVSTMNSFDGRYKANAAIVPAGYQGGVSVYASNTTDVVLDIDGYFEPVSGSTLTFYPLAPCRVVDTRGPNGHLGGPFLQGGVERTLPVLESACGIPATAQAYSFNFTSIPRSGPVYVFTAWPDGLAQPGTSTLNAPTGTVVANAGIVPAGTGGAIDVWASNDSDLLIDVDGYFAPAGTGGLSLYPMAPCRVLDTRGVGSGQPFTGVLSPPVDVVDSVCGPPAAAQAYVFNATIVPAGAPVYFLTLWPDHEAQPTASTLNSYDAAVTSNAAIVPTTNGKVDADAAGLTQLILDISSYFAP